MAKEMKSHNSDMIGEATGLDKIRKQKQNRLAGKRKTSDYEVFYEAMNAGLKPPLALHETFMREADLMLKYKMHGEEYYEEISFLCSKFEEAFAGNEIEQMVDLYDELGSLKLQHLRRNN
jgi:XXXCH domain-containing protein